MFGYIRLCQKNISRELRRVYKSYYCGSCFALQINYGLLSRLILNYDMTTLSILVKAHENPNIKQMYCIGQKKQKKELFTTETWKKISGINILLFAEKLQDNINDDNSISARLLTLIFSKCIKKARRDFPDIYSCIKSGYDRIVTDEKQNLDVLSISTDFANMLVNIFKNNFSLSNKDIIIITVLSRWLYFIDALDDYDKDIKRKRFNPLLISNLSYGEYVNIKYREIYNVLYSILKEVNNNEILKTPLTNEDKIIKSLIEYTIPATTSHILNNQPLPKFQNRRLPDVKRLFNRQLLKFQNRLYKIIFKDRI